MTKTNEDVERFIELRARGLSFDKIAQETGTSKPRYKGQVVSTGTRTSAILNFKVSWRNTGL